MIEIKRCYDCGRWFDDEPKTNRLLCPACETKKVTGRYIRAKEDKDLVLHCELPRYAR